MVKVTCNGLSSDSPPYQKEVETEHMSTEGVRILIPLTAYTRLVNWASLGRTLYGIEDAMFSAQELTSSESLRSQLNDAMDELQDVRDALDECHQAIRRHWVSLPTEKESA